MSTKLKSTDINVTLEDLEAGIEQTEEAGFEFVSVTRGTVQGQQMNVITFNTRTTDLAGDVDLVPGSTGMTEDEQSTLVAKVKASGRTIVCFADVFIEGTAIPLVACRKGADALEVSDGEVLRGDGTWPWFAEVHGDDIVVREAVATAFGGNHDPQDNGETASGVNTKDNPTLQGCSLPMIYKGTKAALLAALGGSPIPKMPFGLKPDGSENRAGAWVEITNRATGQSTTVPVIDLGPSKKTGHALDLTEATARLFKAGASASDFRMTLDYRIINGAKIRV